MTIAGTYNRVRERTVLISGCLETEDHVVQPIIDVSPPKWHLAHSTWFFETFILKKFVDGYIPFREKWHYLFNSYYESLGERTFRFHRGNMTRPTLREIMEYRAYTDGHIQRWLAGNDVPEDALKLLELGINHEEQHQELLLTDAKYILGHNPLFPVTELGQFLQRHNYHTATTSAVTIPDGTIGEAGYRGSLFHFDNEQPAHRVYFNPVLLNTSLVTQGEYLEFINDGGYTQFHWWLAEGWDWVQQNDIHSPLYWHSIDGVWMHYTFDGLQPVIPDEPLCHISYYEADAFARWKGMRLPTEFEWEYAAEQLSWGRRWEWTGSAYLPYPGFKAALGAVGEYNGKFMVHQMVLRGASEVTSPGHSRKTYRNFFHPDKQWQFSGIRLAQDIL